MVVIVVVVVSSVVTVIAEWLTSPAIVNAPRVHAIFQYLIYYSPFNKWRITWTSHWGLGITDPPSRYAQIARHAAPGIGPYLSAVKLACHLEGLVACLTTITNSE